MTSGGQNKEATEKKTSRLVDSYVIDALFSSLVGLQNSCLGLLATRLNPPCQLWSGIILLSRGGENERRVAAASKFTSKILSAEVSKKSLCRLNCRKNKEGRGFSGGGGGGGLRILSVSKFLPRS